MHEIGAVDGIITVINGKLKELKKVSKVKTINIVIGELEHILPEQFEFHFRERVRGALFENAKLNFKKAKAIFKCRDCQSEFSIETGLSGCPKCNSNISDVIKGRGFYVESIEF